MTISAMQAAKAICELKEWQVSHLSLQKMLYFAQMMFIGSNNEDDVAESDIIQSLIDEDFQAWTYGPVVAELYHALKHSGKKDAFLKQSVFRAVDDMDKTTLEYETIKEACDLLGDFQPSHLVELTHDEIGAWVRHYEYKGDNVIPKKAIYDEYMRWVERSE